MHIKTRLLALIACLESSLKLLIRLTGDLRQVNLSNVESHLVILRIIFSKLVVLKSLLLK